MALHRILVADDEESMRWVLSKALRKKGYTVDLAADGNEALRQVREQSYDLAIVDIKMPGMSGLDFLDKAREVRLKLERAGIKTYTQVVETADGKRIRVRVGPFQGRAEADKAAAKIKALNLPVSILQL